MQVIIFVAVYVIIGVAFVMVRAWLIKRGHIWSVFALLDDIDGYLLVDAWKRALRNNRWLWAVWPPMLFAEIAFIVLGGFVVVVAQCFGGIIFGKRKESR